MAGVPENRSPGAHQRVGFRRGAPDVLADPRSDGFGRRKSPGDDHTGPAVAYQGRPKHRVPTGNGR